MSDAGGFDLLHPAIQHHVVNSLGWASLRPLQREAIAPIVAGRHALALAPTASGKTEAAMLPLLHRMTTEGWRGLSVLYLCPLKALLNNLEPRLENLCGFVGRRAALWHGDVGQTVRKAIREDPPDLLLTTPESLEAMLISRHVDHDALLGHVRAVVVDEIHAFAGDDRGWHLVAVLERLSRLVGGNLQRIGLSATVGDPDRLLTWLVGSSEAPRQVVNPPAAPGETIDPDVTVDHVGSVDNAARVIAGLLAGEKRLVFAESRSSVEDLASSLRTLEVQTFVSHSSLSVVERRQAEQAFSEARNCVIVATSTLELGIDVGDLDRVIQLDAPQTVASFLQRLGRTGRRSGTTRNALFLTLRPEERLLQTLGLLLRWRDGFVEAIEPPPLPYHLCGQQILAVVLQEKVVGRSQLPMLVGRLPVFSGFVADGSFEQIVQHLIDTGFLFDDDGVISIGPHAEESFGYRHFIELTSSFVSEPLLAVRWGNNDLGTIDPLSLVQRPGQPPTPLLLGGRSWTVVGVDWRRRTVTVTPADAPGRSRWQGSSRPLSADIGGGMRRVLAGELPRDVVLSKRAEHTLAELRADAPWADLEGTVLVDDGQRRRWWTFAGLRANTALAVRLDSARAEGRVDNLSVPVKASSARELRALLDAAAGVPSSVHPLARPAAEELKFTECLPESLALAQANARLADPSATAVVVGQPVAGWTEPHQQ